MSLMLVESEEKEQRESREKGKGPGCAEPCRKCTGSYLRCNGKVLGRVIEQSVFHF